MKKKTTKEFIIYAKLVHGNKYDYSKSVYVNARTKIEIICSIHGSFWQKPCDHLNKHGCYECYGPKKATREQFISKSILLHGYKYDYSKVVYINNYTKVEIICPIHGSFWQAPNSHVDAKNKGCTKCSGMGKKNIEFIIASSKEIHGNKYDYSKSVYVNARTKIEIICSIHGSFWQTPNKHISSMRGCPICAKESKASKNEIMLREMIRHDFPFLVVMPNYREHPLLDGHEIDIWLPDIELGIEWNGIYWHNSEYVKLKDIAKKQVLGENLIQVVDIGNRNEYFVLTSYNTRILPVINNRVRYEHLFS